MLHAYSYDVSFTSEKIVSARFVVSDKQKRTVRVSINHSSAGELGCV